MPPVSPLTAGNIVPPVSPLTAGNIVPPVSPLTAGNIVALRCTIGGYVGKVAGVTPDEILLDEAENFGDVNVFNCAVAGDGSRGVKHEGRVSVSRAIVLGVEQLATWPPPKKQEPPK